MTGGIGGTTETRVLDWTERSQKVSRLFFVLIGYDCEERILKMRAERICFLFHVLRGALLHVACLMSQPLRGTVAWALLNSSSSSGTRLLLHIDFDLIS